EANYINTAHPDFIDGHKAIAVATDRLFGPRMAQPGSQQQSVRGSSAQHQGTAANMPNLSRGGNSDDGVHPPGFFSSFFGGRKQMETEVIKLLISSYFSIVKRTVADMVPKAIVLHLVTQVRESIQQELLRELYKSEVLDELLKESEQTTAKRRELRQMIGAL